MESGDDTVMSLTLRAEGITKQFNRRSVLRDISFELKTGESLAITGKNGAGKSTLVKIIAGLLTPTKGSVSYTMEEKPLSLDLLRPFIGFVSPYLQLYDEFTAMENLSLIMKIRGNSDPGLQAMENLFRTFALWDRKDDFVRTYSSGMKQRLKYVVALCHNPGLLLFDEPTANLDEEGSRAVRDTMRGLQSSTLLIVATNDEQEASWCGKRIHVGT